MQSYNKDIHFVYFYANKEDCPKNNGYIYNKDTNLCFKIYGSSLRWVDAREMCKKEGGNLIVLDTMDKYNYIKDTIAKDAKGFLPMFTGQQSICYETFVSHYIFELSRL